MTYRNSPLTRCSEAALPLLIKAHGELHGLAAPKAGRIADRIAFLMEQIIELAGDVEAYGNKWTGGTVGQLAEQLHEATREYTAI